MIGDTKDSIRVPIHFSKTEAFLQEGRHLHGLFVVKLDVTIVKANGNDVYKRVVTQAQVLGLLFFILCLRKKVHKNQPKMDFK